MTGTGEGGGKVQQNEPPHPMISLEVEVEVEVWTLTTIFKDSCRLATGTVTYVCTAGRYTLTIFCQR